jgi:hypothetical protein
MSVPDITAGLPVERQQWPDEVLAAAEGFTAGDIVENPPFFYFANPKFAVWAATRNYVEDSEGPEVILADHVAPRYGIITSQTCDLGEVDFDPPTHPWISIAPVYDMSDMDGGTRSLVKKGKGPLHLLHVPKLTVDTSELWVADLRIEFPVEKSWLVGKQPIAGFTNEREQRAVLKRLELIRCRPSWADKVVDVVQRVLMAELKTLKASEKDTYDAVVTEIEEIGGRSDSLLDPSFIQLGAFCHQPLSAPVEAWWNSVNDVIRDAGGQVGLSVQQPTNEILSSCPVTRYRQFEPVPLTRYSPR